MSPVIFALNPQAHALALLLQAGLAGARVLALASQVPEARETYEETAPALRQAFVAGSPIVGICAAGILVRALAPVLGRKAGEPPVIAVAADGSAVVPLLGGLTGAEALAARLAALLGIAPASTAIGALKGERPSRGRVSVVGFGPGHVGWLTGEARAALARADHRVGYETYLAMAERLVPPLPGQARHASDNREELARAREALRLAGSGADVAVVSSGDPGIFAMAAAIFEAVSAEPGLAQGVDLAVLPGLSAMQAVAARAGAPLGHDFAVVSLSDRLKPWPMIEARLDAAARADFVLALYNPASKSRRSQVAAARDLLLRHRAPETPVVLGRDVGREDESVTITTLGAFDPARVDMRTLVIVGSSLTRCIDLADGRRFVFTPRRYDGGDKR